MSLARLRKGEWLALLGAAALLVLLFFDWVGLGASARSSGFTSLGWFMDLLLCVVIFGALAIAYLTARGMSPAWPVGAGVLTSVVGAIVFLVLAIRLLVLAGDLPDVAVAIRWPAYAGLLCAALIPAGAWTGLRDERLDAPESRACTPPPPRSVPGT